MEQLPLFGPSGPSGGSPRVQDGGAGAAEDEGSGGARDEGLAVGGDKDLAGARDHGPPGAAPAPAADLRPSIPVPGEPGLFCGSATRREALAALAARAGECRRCGLRDGCRGVVFGEGDPEAVVLFLGEGPGAVEDEQGRPFVGPAGQLLDKILLAVGFRREEVYITNTVLCRPPGNRVPLPEEVAACRVWLEERLAVMRPPIIVCLGASAAEALLGREIKVSRDRGRWWELGSSRVMPTFHPAALLRDPSKKRAVWEDLKAVREEAARFARKEPGGTSGKGDPPGLRIDCSGGG